MLNPKFMKTKFYPVFNRDLLPVVLRTTNYALKYPRVMTVYICTSDQCFERSSIVIGTRLCILWC